MSVYCTGEAVSSGSDMILAMSCDDGSENIQEPAPQNWLEAKKAAKARSATRLTDRERLVKELDSFLDEPNEAEDSNPLKWWQTNQSKYPTVAVVARMFLCIPATSVASERVFSKCGRVCSERRSLLSPQHVEHLVFLSQNIP